MREKNIELGERSKEIIQTETHNCERNETEFPRVNIYTSKDREQAKKISDVMMAKKFHFYNIPKRVNYRNRNRK